ncbi:MAG: dienelactone hydrolase family protein [Nannocystis sp.]|nr:dienelactone hydrolase family protein [Nannocystis sp.]MBA3546033.1 dienelactone hydrolase family protein [Nannocystis sp.]
MVRRSLVLALSLAACSPSGGSGTADTATGTSSATDATDAISTTTPTATTAGTTSADTGAPTSTGDSDTGEAIDYTAPGPHVVANTRFVLPAGERALQVEVWYPADAAAAAGAAKGHPIAEFVAEGADRVAFEDLLAKLSPAGQIGTRLQTSSAFDGPLAAGGPWPLLVFSHCHSCTRFSSFSIAEHLASHGFVVAAPDHAGNTLFDELAGNSAALGEDFLKIRRADLGAVLDAMLDPQSPVVPASLRGQSDPARVGAFGHSFGAATVGRLAQEDPRMRAAMPIAAPIENPFFPGNKVTDIHVPLLSILAEEDNSIGALGNNLIAQNFKSANPPIRLVRVRDAGHWNFSDICGLTEALAPGCGEGVRQTAANEAFTYLDIDIGRGIARAYAVAFFDRYLRDAPDAAAYLDAPDPADVVTVEIRE